MKVIEWNINHRLNYSKLNMPEWVATVIKESHADVAVLTECCDRVPNWIAEKAKAFPKENYYLFSSNNNQANNNDVVIAIKRETIEVLSINSLFSEGHKAPDYLQIKCKLRETGKIFVIAGIRIHAMNIKDEEKKAQLQSVLNKLEVENTVIIAGDFNCNRRSFTDVNAWNLNKIDSMIDSMSNKKYVRVTPKGSSWARDVSSEDNCCFALDHFLIKGIKGITLCEYDRNFVNNETTIYKWGKDFQNKYGWEKEENNVPAPYPDHAILTADINL